MVRQNNLRRRSSRGLQRRPPDDSQSDDDSLLKSASLGKRRSSTNDIIRGDEKKSELHQWPRTDNSQFPKRNSSRTALNDVSNEDRRFTYSSLPPSPLPTPEPFIVPDVKPSSSNQPPFSLWDYLREELVTADIDSHHDLKWERVSNFLSIPFAIEKIVFLGFMLCLDAFLHTFTILPIRFVLALYQLAVNCVSSSSTGLRPSQKADVVRALLVIIPVVILIPNVDVSKIYHSIRGQDTIKLYVIFNALEIADRLFTSFGEDLIDCLFSRSTLNQLSRQTAVSADKLRPFLYFLLTVICTVLHALMLVYQLTSLNVAINSFDQSLLTLLVSNQFVEIKGSVFKRFEKDNLFQITCADIVERFQLSMMLIVIAFRIMIELSGTQFDIVNLPKSFGSVGGGNMVWTIVFPVLTVLLSEVLVDWLKHAFITKFNHIRPSVYERYTDILCRDLAVGSVWSRSTRKQPFVDHAPFVTRRLGLAALPLGVVAVLVCSQALGGSSASASSVRPWSFASTMQWAILCVMAWFCLIVLKVMLGIQLVMYATRRRDGMSTREAQDTVNDYGRNLIGESPEEKSRNEEIKTMLNRPEVVLNSNSPQHATTDSGVKSDGVAKKRFKLEEVTRFTMTKRIW